MRSDLLFSLTRPLLHRMDAETAHKIAVRALSCPLSVNKARHDTPELTQGLWSIVFPNPVGLAAGFDKNADCVDALLGAGFGFVEAGTVTPRPQNGNPRPRVFRDPQSHSIINRMGFPNDGALAFGEAVNRFKTKGKNTSGILGINIGKNKDTEDAAADYVTLIKRFAGIADYLTVNISSPNTPGLRNLQDPENLAPFLDALMEARADTTAPDVPLLLKLAPDLDESACAEIAKTVMKAGIDGLILTNTTSARPDTLPADFRAEAGGLSGPCLKEKSLEILRLFYRLTEGTIPLIGAGGIASGADAYARIRAGASLVQLYTALVYHGPALVSRIVRDIDALRARDGFDHIAQAVGADHNE